MPAPISIIIPTLNAAETLPECLQALVEGLEAGLISELVVVDGGSSDQSLRLADAWGAKCLSAPPSRGGQLRKGCAAAKGEWLLVLHADTRLAPGWSRAAATHLQTMQAGWFQLRFDQGGRIVAAWANMRARMGLPYGDQGLLLPRHVYDAVGGYRDIPLMEDVSLARALKGRLRPIPAIALTSAKRYQKRGWIRQGARNLGLLLRFLSGTSPEKLSKLYKR